MGHAKRHPLAILICILVLSTLLGMTIGGLLYRRHQQEVTMQYSATGTGAPREIGDSVPFFLLGGLFIGVIAGLAMGVTAYVFLRQPYVEANSLLSQGELSKVENK